MASTTSETCNGQCMDAALYHESEVQTNENGATFCTQRCRETRYDSRCHCGKKYTTEPEASEEQRIASSKYLQAVVSARETYASMIGAKPTDLVVLIRNVHPNLFHGLQLPLEEPTPSGLLRKKYKSDDSADLGISFWRAPTI